MLIRQNELERIHRHRISRKAWLQGCRAAVSLAPLTFRLGLFMMPLHPSYRAIADCYDRDIDQLVLADKLGFDEAWLGEHFTEKWENAPSPDLLIAKALALTERIPFGTGADDPAWDHESLRLLAEEVAPRIADLG